MTLYREVDIPNPNQPERGTLRWVVPVEPCEHESLDGHWWFTTDEKDRVIGEYWCPGAGVGGETP